MLVGVLLAACGSGPGSERVISGQQPASQLLQAWAGFPVHASPRPLVLVGSLVLGPSKFLDGQAKLDFMNGAFNGPASLPAGPATADGYPVISAAAAIALLRSQSHGAPPSPSATHLTITEARFGAQKFLTDRGDRTLPAWLFTLARVDAPWPYWPSVHNRHGCLRDSPPETLARHSSTAPGSPVITEP
jgi:hypothetical protein